MNETGSGSELQRPEDTSPSAPANPSLEAPGSYPARIRNSLYSGIERLGFQRPSRWFWFLALAALVDVVVLSWAQVRAYEAYYTFSQDFGSFNQSFYTALFDHRLFYYTSNLPAGTHGTYFAVHFAPLLFALLPFYALAPAPTTLLVMKVVVLALGAFPVFGIAHQRLGSPQWGLAFGVAFLLSPLTTTLDWISFDMEVFLPFLVLSAFYFLTTRRRIPFVLFWVLALATIETIAPLLGVCAFVALVGTIWGSHVDAGHARREERSFWIGALVLTLGWYLTAYIALTAFSPSGGTFGVGYASHYTVLGASSLADVLPQALLHPDLAGAALAYAGSTKLVYVLVMFGCLAFLSLLGEARYYFPVLGWLVLGLFSNFPPMYSMGSQYLGYVSPFLFAGAIGGAVYLRSLIRREEGPARVSGRAAASRTRRWRLPTPEQAILPVSLSLAVVIALAVANPLTGQPAAGLTSLQYGVPSPSSHAALLDRTVGLIPAGASVLTTAHVFPQVSGRLHAYVLPTTQLFAGSNTYWGALGQFVNESTYVLLDFHLDSYVSEIMLYFGNFSGFGVVVDSDGVFLLERGWTGQPLAGFWSGSFSSYSGASLAVNPKKEVVPQNESLVYVSTGIPNRGMWRGPGLNYVLPGTYTFNVNFRFRAITAGSLFSYELLLSPIVIDPGQYLNTSAGHHYSYVFERPAPTIPSAQLNVTVALGSIGNWISDSASLTFTLTTLGTLSTVGVTLAASFTVYVSGVTMTQVGPPAFLGSQA